MIIDNNFNDNHFKSFNNNTEINIPRKLHNNNGTITPDNSLLTKELSALGSTDPLDSYAMADKCVAMVHERYKNKLMSSENFNKKCSNIAKNRQ